MIFLFSIALGCPEVSVTCNGRLDCGRYFYFSEEEMNLMSGNKNWVSTVLNVTQEGSHSWSGQVKVWKSVDGKYNKGRKNPYSDSEEGDWAVGDTIKLSSCVGGRYICTCIETSTCISI